MFKVKKNADMSLKAAKAKGYSAAEIAGFEGRYTTKAGEIRFKWPFTTHVMGCGNSVPEDYDSNGSYRFDVPDTITKKEAVAEFEAACDVYRPNILLHAANGGVDLKDRATAPRKVQGKVTPQDKCYWVFIHKPKENKQGITETQLIAIYDKHHPVTL